MNYKQVSIQVDTSEVSDILIALLSEEGFEGFEQQENVLIGFIAADVFDENCLSETLRPFNLGFSISDIPKTNWNREWEENFEPVIVDEFCTIRAHFHKIVVSTPYEVVITPKMSFGTGHHATTQLMVSRYFTGRPSFRAGWNFQVFAGLSSIMSDSRSGVDVSFAC